MKSIKYSNQLTVSGLKSSDKWPTPRITLPLGYEYYLYTDIILKNMKVFKALKKNFKSRCINVLFVTNNIDVNSHTVELANIRGYHAMYLEYYGFRIPCICGSDRQTDVYSIIEGMETIPELEAQIQNIKDGNILSHTVVVGTIFNVTISVVYNRRVK